MDLNGAPVRPGSRAAVGFSVHSGWAALVALTITDARPLVLAKARPQLVKSFTYKFRQPYHTAEKMPFDEARGFISGMEGEAKRLAGKTVESMQLELRQRGCDLTHFALIRASGRPLPSLDRTLASHALIHTADGELFRNALAHAAEGCQLKAFTIQKRELVDGGCKILGLKPDMLTRRLTDLGRSIGPPWSQDEKCAALAAWLALAQED